MKSAPYVAQDPLESNEVWLSGIMHVEANLLNNIGNIWPGEGEVLQRSSKTPEVCCILNRGSISR